MRLDVPVAGVGRSAWAPLYRLERWNWEPLRTATPPTDGRTSALPPWALPSSAACAEPAAPPIAVPRALRFSVRPVVGALASNRGRCPLPARQWATAGASQVPHA